MYKNKKILAIIPARGGSKGIPKKNIINLRGYPLIWYTIKAAKASKYIDKLIVSSDSNEIIKIAAKYNIETRLRPKKLATDTVRNITVLKHIINELYNEGKKFDYVLLLQATSPIRNAEDINLSIKKIINTKSDALISLVKAHFPADLLVETIKNKIKFNKSKYLKDLRRQNLKKHYYPNGAIFIHKIKELMKINSYPLLPNKKNTYYIMPEYKSIQIDHKNDLMLAEALLKINARNNNRQ